MVSYQGSFEIQDGYMLYLGLPRKVSCLVGLNGKKGIPRI
jgi:hypothetical protein